jgi:hypothetical protein
MTRLRLVVCVFLLCLPGCAANRPPNLSPTGIAAYTNTRIIQGIDVLRDTAVLANKQQPPLLSEATTRQVVLWHRSALQLINTDTAGWPALVQTGLTEVLSRASPAEAQTLAPYVALIKTLLTEVTRS